MLVLELLYAAIDLGEPLGRFGVVAAALNVAQSARALDVGSPRALSNLSCRRLLSIIASISLCLANMLSRPARNASTSRSGRRPSLGLSPLFVTESGPRGR